MMYYPQNILVFTTKEKIPQDTCLMSTVEPVLIHNIKDARH